jgi:flagellar biosynthesis/type III secretory pathway chaperone
MTGLEQKQPEDWQMLHCALRDVLQQEIHLTRELLSNMHQEEVSLMLKDSGSLNLILQQRSTLLERLGTLRLYRFETTEKIEKIAGVPDKKPSLDEVLPPNEEISTEILSLSDQLMALTERMSRQSNQNQRLTEYGDHIPYPQTSPMSDSRPQKKASIATYQIKK